MVDLEGNSRPIEEIQEGDWVLARKEFDPQGPLELKRVEELFTRTSPIIELEIGGQKIGTTEEHPFYIPAREAFVPARELQVGDQLVSHDGRLLGIDAIHSTLQIATVYNLRVADYHTYFVGCDEWGFNVWAHNADCVVAKELVDGKLVYRARSTTGELLAEGGTYAKAVRAAEVLGHTVHDVAAVRKAFLVKHGLPEELIGPSGLPWRHIDLFPTFKGMRESGVGSVKHPITGQPRRVPGRVDKHVHSPTPPGSKWGGHTHEGGAVLKTVILSDGTKVPIKFPKVYNINRRGGTASIHNRGPVNGVRFETVPTWKLLGNLLE